MLKKIILQVFLLFFILVSCVIFFNTYFKEEPKNKKVEIKKKLSIKEEDKPSKEQANLIYDVVYKSNNENGNNYVILSKVSELPDITSAKGSIIVSMKGVEATIDIKNSSPIKIVSDSAIFNKTTYDTKFLGKVLIIFDDHVITSNNLDLFFQKNLAIISNDIIYKNLNTVLQADMIEIDMLTKESKIFMNNDKKKIKISTSN